MSPAADRLPPLVSDLIATLAAAAPIHARRTLLDLSLGAALTMPSHVTAAITPRVGVSGHVLYSMEENKGGNNRLADIVQNIVFIAKLLSN